MPTFDGGHGFLTALLPISTSSGKEQDIWSSPVHLVREHLAALPTAQQSPFTPDITSPFARNDKTHFLRMAVIDDIVFNGRLNKDTLFGGQDPTVPQKPDSLNCAYLLFSADFDAPKGRPSELDAYLAELWDQVQPELEPILSYCHGFPSGTGSAGFVAFIRERMIDTTMPFNDYWPDTPPLEDPDHVGLAAAGAVLWLAACFVVYWVTHLLGWRDGVLWHLLFSLLVGTGIFASIAVRLIGSRGNRPFPAAPGSSLPSVLKSLYLQRAFGSFASSVQPILHGERQSSDAALFEAFGRFLDNHKPSLDDGPTQPPGTVPLGRARP